MSDLVFALLLCAAAFVLVIGGVLVTHAVLIDLVALGSERRYRRLRATRSTAVAVVDRPIAVPECAPTPAPSVRADLPWDREPIELDGRWSG